MKAGSYLGNNPVYDYHVFVSYARPDVSEASKLAKSLLECGLRVFFAPESFPAAQVTSKSAWGPDSPYGWSGPLESALLTSCHFIGLVTHSYAETPWCDLEYIGFKHIHQQNPQRKLVLMTTEMLHELPACYSNHDALVTSLEEANKVIFGASQNSGLSLGEKISPRDSFLNLPLEAVPFQSGFPWDDTEQGSIYEPPYHVFEGLVRELMIRLRKGASASQLREDVRSIHRGHLYAAEALFAASHLVAVGVGPEGVASAKPTLREPQIITQQTVSTIRKPIAPQKTIAQPTEIWELRCRDPELQFGFYDIICTRCGYSDDFHPGGGERLPTVCPQCGFHGK